MMEGSGEGFDAPSGSTPTEMNSPAEAPALEAPTNPNVEPTADGDAAQPGPADNEGVNPAQAAPQGDPANRTDAPAHNTASDDIPQDLGDQVPVDGGVMVFPDAATETQTPEGPQFDFGFADEQGTDNGAPKTDPDTRTTHTDSDPSQHDAATLHAKDPHDNQPKDADSLNAREGQDGTQSGHEGGPSDPARTSTEPPSKPAAVGGAEGGAPAEQQTAGGAGAEGASRTPSASGPDRQPTAVGGGGARGTTGTHVTNGPANTNAPSNEKFEEHGSGSNPLGWGRLAEPTEKSGGGPGWTKASDRGDHDSKAFFPKGVSVGAKQKVLSGEHQIGANLSGSAKTDVGTFAGQTRAGGWENHEVGLKVSEHGAGIYGKSAVGAGIEATGQWNAGDNIAAGGTVLVGGRASVSGSAEASFGPDGVKITASAKGDAFAGVSAGGDLKITTDIGSATAGAEALAGIGAEGSLSGEVSMNKVEFGMKGGVALGVGLTVSFNISFSPSGIASEAAEGLSSIGDAISDLF